VYDDAWRAKAKFAHYDFCIYRAIFEKRDPE